MNEPASGRAKLSIAFGHAKGSGSAAFSGGSLSTGEVDGAKCLFVLHDVVLKSEEQTLCVFGSQYDTALYVSLGYTGEYADEVEYYFGA